MKKTLLSKKDKEISYSDEEYTFDGDESDEFSEDSEYILFEKFMKLMKYEKWNVLEGLLRKSIKLDFDVNKIDEECGLSILGYASKEARVYISEKIIEYGADINLLLKDNKTALHHSVLIGKDDIVRLLINKNANPLIQTVEFPFFLNFKLLEII
jgi:ankyrin repeat protein